uniref:FGE-sulfatase domain-containing protein n=1 Tax=Steinernema glaseri TaxID=37863 RepID=A0A1I8A227_9BILA
MEELRNTFFHTVGYRREEGTPSQGACMNSPRQTESLFFCFPSLHLSALCPLKMRLANAFLLWLLCFVNDGTARGESGDVFTPEWDKQLPECKMDEFRNAFFHTVGCRGFVRVPMEGRTLKQMNRKIDGILRKQRGKNKDKNCVPVRLFYYNETSLIFLRYPDFKKKEEPGFDRTVASWVANLKDQDNDTFIAFPSIDQWKRLGDGYEYEEYEQQENTTGMICEPRNWFYDLEASNFMTFGCGWNSRIPWTDPMLSKEARMGLTVAEYENITKSRDDLYIASSYDGQSLRSYRRYFTYYILLERRDPDAVNEYKETKSRGEDVTLPTGTFCRMRQIKGKYGEQAEAYILPRSRDVPM